MQFLHAALVSIIMAVWAQFHPNAPKAHDAKTVADAIATVVIEDADNAPVLTSHVEDATLMAFWALRESSIRNDVAGDGGRSFGYWQQRTCQASDAEGQARCWLQRLHMGKTRCEKRGYDSPTAVMWGDCHVKTVSGIMSDEAGNLRVQFARKLLQNALMSQ